jgi:hypothetical protein
VRQPKPRFCFAPPGLTEVKADRCSAALLGMTHSCVPLCPLDPKTVGSRVALVERSSLPAPRPGWPRFRSRKSLHIACRGDRTFGHLPHLRSRFRPSDEAGTAVPITVQNLTPVSESRKAKNVRTSLWITWISGTTGVTFSVRQQRPISKVSSVPNRLPFRSPKPTSGRCLNRPKLLPSLDICRA